MTNICQKWFVIPSIMLAAMSLMLYDQNIRHNLIDTSTTILAAMSTHLWRTYSSQYWHVAMVYWYVLWRFGSYLWRFRASYILWQIHFLLLCLWYFLPSITKVPLTRTFGDDDLFITELYQQQRLRQRTSICDVIKVSYPALSLHEPLDLDPMTRNRPCWSLIWSVHRPSNGHDFSLSKTPPSSNLERPLLIQRPKHIPLPPNREDGGAANERGGAPPEDSDLEPTVPKPWPN